MTDHIYDPKAIRQAKNRIEKQKGTDLSDSSLRVAIYTRVSSEMQLDGYSLDFKNRLVKSLLSVKAGVRKTSRIIVIRPKAAEMISARNFRK